MCMCVRGCARVGVGVRACECVCMRVGRALPLPPGPSLCPGPPVHSPSHCYPPEPGVGVPFPPRPAHPHSWAQLSVLAAGQAGLPSAWSPWDCTSPGPSGPLRAGWQYWGSGASPRGIPLNIPENEDIHTVSPFVLGRFRVQFTCTNYPGTFGVTLADLRGA